METLLLNLIILLILLFFSSFFSGSETALFSLKRTELLNFRKSNIRKERLISNTMRSPQKILISILIGNLAVNLFVSMLTTDLLLKYYPAYGHIIAIAIVTPILILFCEITPKVLALDSPTRFSKRIISLLSLFHFVFFPIRFFYQILTVILIKIFRIKESEESMITEKELDVAVAMSEDEGVIREKEGDFIRNVLRFSKKEAENVMIPRNKAVSIPYGATIDDARKIFTESGVVRAVVCKESMDDIAGQVDSRDLIPFLIGSRKGKNINRLITPITYYPESKELGDLLDDFLKNKIQLAVVVDEYGGTSGIVTLSSIITELMGENFSLAEKVKKPEIKKLDDKTSIISGDMQIDDFNYSMNASIETSEAETMGGYIIEVLGHFPERQDEIKTNGYIFKVRNIQKNKIISLEVIEDPEFK